MSLKPAETHQANNAANCLRKNVQHIHHWINPIGKPVIAIFRSVKAGDLPSQLGEGFIRGCASFERAKRWIRFEVLPGCLFIVLQSLIKYHFIIRVRRVLRRTVRHSGSRESERSRGKGKGGVPRVYGRPCLICGKCEPWPVRIPRPDVGNTVGP